MINRVQALRSDLGAAVFSILTRHFRTSKYKISRFSCYVSFLRQNKMSSAVLCSKSYVEFRCAPVSRIIDIRRLRYILRYPNVRIEYIIPVCKLQELLSLSFYVDLFEKMALRENK